MNGTWNVPTTWTSVGHVKAGKLPLLDTPRRWIPSELLFHGIQSVSIVSDAMFLASELPGDHRDPFDRLIGAQAEVGAFRLVSPDDAFTTLGIDRLW